MATSMSSGGERKRKGLPRLWCHIYLHMKVPGFDLVPMIIGCHGCNTGRIATQTSTKIRVRGQGSGHLEFPYQKEAPAPLMVAVTANKINRSGFEEAVHMTVKLLCKIEKRFVSHCWRMVGCAPEGPPFTFGDVSPSALDWVASTFDVKMATIDGVKVYALA